MMEKTAKISFLLVCLSLLCAVPVTAAITTITQGNVVFIGEEGLDISFAMGPDTQIGWWASAADIGSSAPTKMIDVSTRLNTFMVSPTEFSAYTGNWYRIDGTGRANGIAFSVADPQLVLKVEDTTTEVNVELLKWIPTGDNIRFRIESNLVQMASQRGSPPLVNIYVQSPDGATYTVLYDAGNNPTSVFDIPVTSNPFFTNALWNMGNAGRYPAGTYTIWAEWNVNRIKDNYPVTGKTISSTFLLLNQGRNPLMSTATTVMTTQPPTFATIVTPTQTMVTTLTMAPTQQPTMVTAMTTVPVPTATTQLPATTKSPGFGAVLAGASLLVGLVLILRK
jgi:hypothetical protein